MSLRASWRKTVVGGLVVGCAGVTLQCGGGSSSAPSADAGAAGNPTAGSVSAGGAAGSVNGKAGGAGSSNSNGGVAGEDASGRGGSSPVTAGTGGKGAGSGGVGTAGSAGVAGTGTGGAAGNSGASAAGGAETNGGTAGTAASAGVGVAGGGTSSAGSAGSIAVAGSSGTVGSAGLGGSSGTSGASGTAGASGSGGSGGACSNGVSFQPRAPVVFFLLDRSSSMFLPTDYWSPVKASVLATISAYASQIRFGLAAYTGVVAQTCPLDVTNAGSIALDNYGNINQVLATLASPATKAESPTAAAIASIRPTVSAQSGTSKTIFLVTDGGHDFCNDGLSACGADGLVAELQTTFTAGVRTSVFGVQGSPYLDATQTQAQANAGSGVAVVGDSLNTYYICNGEPPWHALWVQKGSPANQSLGSYVTTSASNTPYTLLDTTQPDTMTSALKAATAALKSCIYDVSGGQLNQALAGAGVVRVDGMSVPMDANNGWRLNSSTELELVGSACSNWRSSTAHTISFEFPCSILNP